MKFKTWDEVEKELYTPEEIAESDQRVAIIEERVKARNGANIKAGNQHNNCMDKGDDDEV